MQQERDTVLGEWKIETSQCRCLPVRAGLRLRRHENGGAVLSVRWEDADAEAVLTRSGGVLEAGRASFRFSTADGESHLLVAAVHREPGGRRRLFGYMASRNGRGDTGTGAYTANEVDPDQDAQGDAHKNAKAVEPGLSMP